MKLANPLNYPIPMLVAGVALVVGARWLRLPPVVILPTAGAIAMVGAAIRKAQVPIPLLDNPELEQQLQAVRQQAKILADKANKLRQEAGRILTGAEQMDLLVALQESCDRSIELPGKIDHMAHQFQGSDSLLDPAELKQQLREIDKKIPTTQGIAREQLQKLRSSLQRNIKLAQQGQDARQAQVMSCQSLVLEAAGVLQELQNKLRSVNVSDLEAVGEIRSLSEQLNSYQDNLDTFFTHEG